MDVEYAPGWQSVVLWTVVVGFAVVFLLAFGMGANDCANSYGTVVGAGVLRLWQAYLLATVFEITGALLLGYKVTGTIRSGIVDVSMYDVFARYNASAQHWQSDQTPCNDSSVEDMLHNCTMYSTAEFYYGELGALTGTAVWLVAASLLRMPVSATQSVVGALIGFSLVFNGVEGINWYNAPFSKSLLAIVLSWVASPALAGFFSVAFYLTIKLTVFVQRDQVGCSVRMLPFWFWFTLTVNLVTVFYQGSKFLHLDQIQFWQALLISSGIGLAVAVAVRLWAAQHILRRAQALHKESQQQRVESNEAAGEPKKGYQSAALLGLPRRTVYHTFQVVELELSESEDGDVHVNQAYAAADVVDNAKQQPTVRALLPTTAFRSSCFKNAQVAERPDEETLKQRLANVLGRMCAPVEEHPVACHVFNILQIISACVLAFSHGSNDTSNAVGPLVAIVLSYMSGTANKVASHHMSNTLHSLWVVQDESDNPYMQLIILYGAVCMLCGLYVLGHKVIQTIGKDLTDINAPSGFSMSLGTAFTVLFASKVGIPVSTTHCMVGAVVAVGLVRQSGQRGVDWSLFGGIAFAWLVTCPVTCAISAAVTAALAHFLL